MGEFDGKIAVITGAANGIGRATAGLLAEGGAKVVIGDVEVEAGQKAAKDIGGAFVETDVFKYPEIERLVAGAVERHGKVDFMINNAGSTGTMHGIRNQPVWEMPADHIDWIIGLNLRHQIYGSKAVVPQMIKQGFGSIVNFGSAAAFVYPIGQATYAAAKGGVVVFTQTLAKELGPYGIRANVVAPGLTRTRVWEHQLDGKTLDEMLEETHQPGKRAGTPQELANVVVFLCSERSNRINGATIRVDGGI